MQIAPFETEHFYARYEFSSPHLLSTSDCESVPVAELLEIGGSSLEALGGTTLGYGESEGRPELRKAVASTYEEVDPESVLVLNAPVEGIFIAMSTLLEPGDRVVVLGPCYDALVNTPRFLVEDVRLWMLEPKSDGWALDLDALEELLSVETKLLVVNFPHNPTGFLPSRDELDAVVSICERRGVWLLSDEMYRGLDLPGTEAVPSAADRYRRAVTLSGLSKSYGLPGLRCGWLVARDPELYARLLNWKFYTSICPPAPIEALALAALAAREHLIGRNVDRIARNVKLADAFFREHSERFTWRPPRAGSVALVGVDTPSATEYCHALAKDAGIVLLPSAFLGYDDRHVRFGFGRESFPEALGAFERHLASG